MRYFGWIFPLKKKLRTRNDDFKFPRGLINFRRVNDPAETVSAWSMTETVCKAFCHRFFRQLVTIRATTHTYNHTTGYYKFD
jgi:hypothetical protein